MGETDFRRSWLDRTHAYITSMLCQPAVWFDGFFGEHRAGEDWAGSLVRWQGAMRFDELEGQSFRSTLDAGFRLPNMNKRFKLVINSQTGNDESMSLPDEDPYNLGTTTDTTGPGKRKTAAGLRYEMTNTKRTLINIGAGLKLGSTIQPYLRFRLRHTLPLSPSTLLRLTPSVIWLEKEGINRYLRVDLDHRIGENTLIRGSQSVAKKEMEPGVQWGSSLTLYDRLSAVMVLAYQAAVKGTTFPETEVLRYRMAARVRSNFLRDWLFMEIEPEYYWPRDDLGQYHLYRAITFRLEVQFYS